MKLLRNFLFVLLGFSSMKSFYQMFKYQYSNKITLTYGFDDLYFQHNQFNQFLCLLNKAAHDPKVRGIAINYQGAFCASEDSIANINELTQVFDLFKRNKKFVDFYIPSLTFKSLYLASHASSITLTQNEMSHISGIHIHMPFVRDALKAQGIEVTSIATGEFKTPESESRNSMSDEYKDGLKKLLKACSDLVINDIKLHTNIENGMLGMHKNADIAKKYSFINISNFATWSSRYNNKLSTFKYARICKDRKSYNKIAVINVNGTIRAGSYLGNMSFISQIDNIARNPRIKAVILRIDSGGGSAYISNEIYNALIKLKEKKLLVASIKDICASGSYILALSADKIFAPKCALVGSIGVIMNHVHIQTPGVNVENIDSHDMPDINSYTPITAEQKKEIIVYIKDALDQFRKLVANQRKFSLEYSRQISLGQVYTGRDAKSLGLIDEEGSLLDALKFIQYKKNLKHYEIMYV
ncbi:S49 family peptidase [Candidatus Cytomitobacter primus]|uniref:Peptidase S49 domain-containing protein n=1 Tax=Candidatus Cytomitobacter primus TaxID=2066024 RepID=A0A5C0UF26_9PROT|nr:S49 family peptidase [Candidatus Cytomitobacter primus]QEK38658.1 hypothetical protein FZC34_01915 [Candidatus Cytomitobacter primus]